MTRIYVSDVSQVPDGYMPKYGRKGGIYYEASKAQAEEDYLSKEGKLENEQFLFQPKVHFEEDVIGSVVLSIGNEYYKITDIYSPGGKGEPVVELTDVYGRTYLSDRADLPNFIPDNAPQYNQLNAKIEEELNKLQAEIPWNIGAFNRGIDLLKDQLEDSGNEMTEETRAELARIDKTLYEAKLDDGNPIYGKNERLQYFTTSLAERRTLFGDVRIEWFDRIETGTYNNMGPEFLKEQKDLYDSCKKMISVVMQTEDQKVIDATFHGALVFREWTSNNFDQVAPILCEAIQQQVENSRPKYVKRSKEADDYDNRILKYATKENLLAFKAFSSKIASLAYGESIQVYRGLSVPEHLAQLSNIWTNKSTEVKGTLYSFSDEMDVARSFSDIGGSWVKANIGTDGVWGGWWVASPRHDAQEREIICDVPQAGLQVDNNLSEELDKSYHRLQESAGKSVLSFFDDKMVEAVKTWQQSQGHYNMILETILQKNQDEVGEQIGNTLAQAASDITDGFELPQPHIDYVQDQLLNHNRSIKWAKDNLFTLKAYKDNCYASIAGLMHCTREQDMANPKLQEGINRAKAKLLETAKLYEDIDLLKELARMQSMLPPERQAEEERRASIARSINDENYEGPDEEEEEEPKSQMSEWSSDDEEEP